MTAVGSTVETARLVQGLNRLGEIAFGFAASKAFQTGFDLGVFEALSEGAFTSDALASRLEIHPTGCRRLLMMLVSLGLLERSEEGFRNSEVGQLCSSRSPINLGTVSHVDPFYRMYEYLPDALREYGPVWQKAIGITGRDAFTALYADPVRLRQFAGLMNALSVPQGQLIAESFDFTPHTCVMDVAGGPGGQVIPIGLRYPHLRGIVTDMEPVCVVAREQIDASGLGGRFTAVAADLIEGPYPAGADVILLGHILHDWSDDVCRRIVRHCAAALPAGGVLLVSESVLDADFSGSRFAHIKDLTMLVANEAGARERSRDEFASLLGEAGFAVDDVIQLDAPRDLLVARKQPA
jgi:O-methyltransferase domain/Dimerisation domain